jgi:hypothetical protein
VQISGHTFTKRFLQHVLPFRFVRIRRYGILSNRARHKALALSRASLHADRPLLLAPPGETRSAALIRIFKVEPDTCPDCGEGNTSARLRTDSDVAYPRSIQHQHEGTMNARPIRRSISGPRSAAQISLQICLRTLVDRPVGSPSLSEDSRPHRTARATPSAPSAEPSETQNIHLTRQHHSSNTPSPQIPRLSPTQAFRSRRASGEVHSGTAAEALLFVRRLRATTDGSQR